MKCTCTREIIDILLESDMYFDMDLKERRCLVEYILATYPVKDSASSNTLLPA
ncbi:hypothetical protein BMS3Abin07_02113 [bacterium BMS3Abin07]|nr:hypothetical protein BMS3Abin07_02113 [bacterium BMS3Abin07]GBE32546.1 hypothetical protein BMS3Bbin05_01462 [bacterium BMS3Bbin05]